MLINYRLSINKNERYKELPLNLESKAQTNLKAVISLKQAGNMAYYNNNNLSFREKLFEELKIDKNRVFSLYQKHTKRVVFIEKGAKPSDYSGHIADGMVTNDSNSILSITIGDCLPVFIIDKSSSAFGLVHSGWKGTGIVKTAVELMEKKQKINRKNIKVLIGHGIGLCCYKVDKTRYNYYTSSFGKNAGQINNNDFYINMKQANINILKEMGIEDIINIEDCTFCNPNLSSFRRDGKEGLSLMVALIGHFNGGLR